MLTTEKHLYLAELKDRNYPGVNSQAIDQLESTIQFLYQYHPDITSAFKHKKAFACNKRKPHFVEIDNSLQRRFFDTYKFRIDVQATILVV